VASQDKHKSIGLSKWFKY